MRGIDVKVTTGNYGTGAVLREIKRVSRGLGIVPLEFRWYSPEDKSNHCHPFFEEDEE